MHNPPHPGEVLRELYLDPMGLSVTELARQLGVTRTALSQVINGRSRVSLDMALRLSGAFRTSAEMWLNLQHQRDLWLARTDPNRPRVKPLVAKRRAAG